MCEFGVEINFFLDIDSLICTKDATRRNLFFFIKIYRLTKLIIQIMFGTLHAWDEPLL